VDFGLAVPTARETIPLHDAVAGTPLYMSPEQLIGAPLTPASDWYSFGLTLYEAISGKAPSPVELFGSASAFKAKSLRSRGFDVPSDLDDLVVALLARDSAARPGAAEILRCLGGQPTDDASRPSLLQPRDSPEFIGRETELALLERLFDDGPTTCAVRVLGPSGIGKTSIVRTLFDSLRERSDTLLLQSKCHPQETVVFNAIDGLIDGLAGEVADCLDEAERSLPPSQHDALTQVFPVLAKVLTSGHATQLCERPSKALPRVHRSLRNPQTHGS